MATLRLFGIRVFPCWMRRLWQGWRLWCEPPGLFVAVLGSDGAGKSTLIDRLRHELADVFPRSAVFHLRAGLRLRETPCGPIREPHGRPVYPLWLSCLKLGYYVVVYALGYAVRVRPRLARSALVLFDRYYDDLLVDPRRYRYGGPMALAARAGRFIPRPDLFLVLDAPEPELLRRKQEVSEAELRRQRVAYRRLSAALPAAVLLDGSAPPADVARRGRQAILTYLTWRWRGPRRHGGLTLSADVPGETRHAKP